MVNNMPGNDIVDLIRRGGVFYNISGTGPKEVLANMIETVPAEFSVGKEALLQAVLEREELMPTAVGHGIALPHPRTPLIDDPAEQCIVISFLKQAADWNALDGQPVHTLILIMSASPKLHLQTLSRISYLCQQEEFQALLKKRASLEEIISAVRSAETAWR
ncbi:PTS sugar transporter subunit IIA [Treponema sp. OttesenSCG-928-L16]|nr:PTS sugar transporter subunit IIA [Treponema sp. OttesenSCG-928-L16]